MPDEKTSGPGEYVVQMKQITKIYANGAAANRGVDFNLRRGEIHALMGENGAGKSTLMKMLFGLEQPTSGEIFVNGEKLVLSSPSVAIAHGIGMVHQHFMLVPSLSVAENMVLGMVPRKSGMLIDYKEAVRITKPGGHILVAYCMNEATVIQYVFGCNQLKSVMDLNMMTDDWKCISEPKDLFEMVRVEDIERLNASLPVKRVKLVATDGASRYIREYLEEFDDETFAKWLSYHFATCERQDLIGATNHSLDILRKV